MSTIFQSSYIYLDISVVLLPSIHTFVAVLSKNTLLVLKFHFICLSLTRAIRFFHFTGYCFLQPQDIVPLDIVVLDIVLDIVVFIYLLFIWNHNLVLELLWFRLIVLNKQ